MRTAFYAFSLSYHLRLDPPPPFLAQMMEADVCSNAEQPSLKLAVSAKAGDSPKAPDKYFLCQVVGILPSGNCISKRGPARTAGHFLFRTKQKRLLCYPHGCMAGAVLDGKKISRTIQEELKPRIEALRLKKRAPALAVVLVGDNPASQIYVRSKIKACQELGIRSIEIFPPSDIGTEALIEEIRPLTIDPTLDGILIQMPLPKQIDADLVASYVDSTRDVDGFGVYNLGRLILNEPAPRACTPAGILEMLKRYQIPIAGKHAVVVGRSNIVGKPMALMLLHENATVTMCHSRTRDLAGECRRADILVAAIGKAGAITADHIKLGAVLVDVGMNRITDPVLIERLLGHDSARMAAFTKNGSALVGDIEPRAMQELSSAYTPVPGGVGPLTIAMLMANTVLLAETHLNGKSPG